MLTTKIIANKRIHKLRTEQSTFEGIRKHVEELYPELLANFQLWTIVPTGYQEELRRIGNNDELDEIKQYYNQSYWTTIKILVGDRKEAEENIVLFNQSVMQPQIRWEDRQLQPEPGARINRVDSIDVPVPDNDLREEVQMIAPSQREPQSNIDPKKAKEKVISSIPELLIQRLDHHGVTIPNRKYDLIAFERQVQVPAFKVFKQRIALRNVSSEDWKEVKIKCPELMTQQICKNIKKEAILDVVLSIKAPEKVGVIQCPFQLTCRNENLGDPLILEIRTINS